MARYEYKVVPAPTRGVRSRAVKGNEARFAKALTESMNELARAGWEYHRSETLPAEERAGLMGHRTVYRNLLVFRRRLSVAQEGPLDDAEAALGPALPAAEPAGRPPERRPETSAEMAEAAAASLGGGSAGRPALRAHRARPGANGRHGRGDATTER